MALTAGAVPAAEAKVVSFTGTNASGTNTTVCGADQSVFRREYGEGATVRVQGAKTRKGRRKRKGTIIVTDKCVNGKWAPQGKVKMGARRKAKTIGVSTSRAAVGDYRIRLTKKGKPVGSPAYLRVGAGEIVDIPVTFSVVNQDRIAGFPCGVNTPDGKTYKVRGTIVGPRSTRIGKSSQLASPANGPGVSLYYHGFGYRSYFFRFKGAPGYDYAADQAVDGHTSVVVDRLGYGESPGPADGNKLCYASQADIADQLVGALRSGRYTDGEGGGAKFGNVALVGHSAGGFIAEIAQGAFDTADALVLIGFNNTFPSPLAGAELTASSGRCATGGQQGENGASHYTTFGDNDADYIKGHLFNVDPAVQAAALKLRPTEPCGDVLSIPPSFAFSQAAVRAIRSPSLLVAGDHDAFFPLPGAPSQQAGQQLFSPFAEPQQLAIIKDTGHAVTLSRNHEEFRTKMNKFLTTYGF